MRGFSFLEQVSLSKTINILIGANNSGKSTILNSIFQLQRRVLTQDDITIGQQEGSIEIFYEGSHRKQINPPNRDQNHLILELHRGRYFKAENGSITGPIPEIEEREPNNLIYPYLSKRKTLGYESTINEPNANSVTGNLLNLYSKIDRLIAPQYQPANRQYIEACDSIFGFQVSTLAKGNGKQGVYYIKNSEHIPLAAMGEGVSNALGLICDLCVAENKIFLIEEPENDIHPKALKALLNLIIEKSDQNQFFISTHSNIVMKYLGTAPEAKLFHVTSIKGYNKDRPNLYKSDLVEIADDPEERRKVLEDLGYDMFDFDMWSAWLFLEESSAETIIKRFLIPWFAKGLIGKLRTFSAGGVSEIEPKFEDFNKLFVFLHLEPTYKNKVWVLIDKGVEEDKIISRLKNTYSSSGWNTDNFMQFKNHDFEKYYPKRFQDEAKQAIEIADKQTKREAKKVLLKKVLEWISADEELAKKEFQISASEVIDKLKEISKQLNK